MIFFDPNLIALDGMFVHEQKKVSKSLNSSNMFKHKKNKIQLKNISCFYRASTKDFYKQNKFNKAILLSNNFITRLINKYWQETIFISLSNPEIDKYANILKVEGANTYSTHHKEFITYFGKALTLGRIQSSSTSNYIKNNKNYVKYTWRKGINFPLINYLNIFIKKVIKLNNYQDNSVVKVIQQYNLPLFTITNNFNQIILAESPDLLVSKTTWTDLFYNWLIKHFSTDLVSQYLYQGLFFINPDDAIEYKNYINNKYLLIETENKVQVFSTRLDVYYSLIRSRCSTMCFRLIPDLKELGLLMSKYRYYPNVHFHANQLFGKNVFQGQPIYVIDSMSVKNKLNKKNDLVNYNYLKNDQINSGTVFLSYRTATAAWQQFIENTQLYDLPTEPQITVYNIESLIKDLEKTNHQIDQSYLFVPPQESYKFIKKQAEGKLSENALDRICKKLIPLQIMLKKIIWSLTSRQSTNW